MRLERVEVRHVSLPLLHAFETSFGRTTHKEFLLVAATRGRAHRLRGRRGGRRSLLPARDERDRAARPQATSWRRWRSGSRSSTRATCCRLRARARPPDGEGRAGDGGLGAVGAPRGRAALRAARRPRRARRGRRLDRAAARRGGAGGDGRRRGRRRLPARQDQDQAGPRPRAWSRPCARASRSCR